MVMQQVQKSADAMKPNQSTLNYIKGTYYLLNESLDLSLFRVRRSQNQLFWNSVGFEEIGSVCHNSSR